MKIPSKPLAFMALSVLLALVLQMAVAGKVVPAHAQIGQAKSSTENVALVRHRPGFEQSLAAN